MVWLPGDSGRCLVAGRVYPLHVLQWLLPEAPAGTLAVLYGKLQRVLGSAHRVKGALDSRSEQLGQRDSGDWQGERAKGTVQFNDVVFSYPVPARHQCA